MALQAAPERLAEHSFWEGAGEVVRLHIGLEHPLDLVGDLDRAFGVVRESLRRSA